MKHRRESRHHLGSAPARRRAVLSTLAVVGACVLAGCSGGSTPPSVAQLGSQTSSTLGAASSGNSGAPPSARQLRALTAYASCVRRHGLPQFPNPPYGNGELSRLGFTKAQLYQADRACRATALAAGVVPSQAAIQQHLQQMLDIARCMRANGVPNFPDPDSNGQFNGSNINVQAPQYVAAAKKCGGPDPGGSPHGG